MSAPALVTVVVCTYDHERYVARAMESVLEQEAPFGIDVVVLDDCSTDGTMSELARLAVRYPGRFVVRQPPANRNDHREFAVALDEASTPYVAMLDGDDYWTSPSKLAIQLAHLERNPQYAMTFHPVARVDEDDRPLPDLPESPWDRPTAVRDDLWRGCFIQASSVVFRRSAYDLLPTWYQESSFGDWELYLLLAERGDIGFLSERMSAYRVHAGGVWSGEAPRRRAQQVERFYALAARVEGAAFRRNRAATLSRAFSLSYWNREAGASWRAWRWGAEAAARALLHRPGPHAPSRGEVRDLLRAQVAVDRGRLRRHLGGQCRPWSSTQRQ